MTSIAPVRIMSMVNTAMPRMEQETVKKSLARNPRDSALCNIAR